MDVDATAPRDDLVYATSGGIWGALSNRHAGFGQPKLLSAYFSAAHGWDVKTVQEGLRFGHFIKRGLFAKDLLMASARGILVARNFLDSFGVPQLWSDYAASPAALATLQVRDLNGDGFDNVVVRDLALGQVLVLTTRTGGLGGIALNAPQAWMTFAGQTNSTGWSDPNHGATIGVARFGKKMMLTAGSTTGVIYSTASAGAFNAGWRHLCNTCYTTLTDWRPERQAAAIAWADLDGSGSEWVIFTRNTGLEIAPGITP